MLARHIVNIESGAGNDFLGIVELRGLRQMRDVAGMDHEGRLFRRGADLADRFRQSLGRIWVGRLIEAEVAVGDLSEAEGLGRLRMRRLRTEKAGDFRNSA